LKRLLDTWDRNGSTSGPTPWHDDDDGDDDDDDLSCLTINVDDRRELTDNSRGIIHRHHHCIRRHDHTTHHDQHNWMEPQWWSIVQYSWFMPVIC
jgi:hypothetical protein